MKTSTWVDMGTRQLELGGPEFGELRESTGLMHNVGALRERMWEDGYLLIRGLHDREKVLSARQAICDALKAAGALAPGSDPMEAVINPDPQAPRLDLESRQDLGRHEAVAAVLEGERIFSLFTRFLGELPLTFRFKWLRAVGQKQFTGVHYDIVYMGRGSRNLYTCWTPFGDVPIEQGTLAICVGSHRLPGFEKLRRTYGQMDVDRDRVEGGGWYTTDPLEITRKFGGQWQTTSFGAGDVIIFGMFTLHASTNNTTDRYRISCDTRFQPAREPVDNRWAGEHPPGHEWLDNPESPLLTMEEAKARWES